MPEVLPDHLQAYKDWTREEFIADAIEHGYTPEQGEYIARRYMFLFGTFKPVPPASPWKNGDRLRLYLRMADGRIFWLASKGRRYQFLHEDGSPASPEQPHLAGAIGWAHANDLTMP
jgi:hypothetical protein